MDSYLTAELIKALSEGDMKKFAAYLAIFVIIWLEVRGMKKQLRKMNETISFGFAAGEKRFGDIEKHQVDIEHRVTVLEEACKPKVQGGQSETVSSV